MFVSTHHRAKAAEDLTYQGIHSWIRRTYAKTGRCEYCGRTDRRTDYASGSHVYSRNWADWFELCRFCHRAFDGGVAVATRAKISAANKGRKLTLEQRTRLSAARKGVPQTPEHVAARVASFHANHKPREF